jgi:hypothetical protein
MDPFTAFSFAGTVLEFSRFGTSLLKEGRELYRSTHGALTANEELELVTADLGALLVKLRQRFPAATTVNSIAHGKDPAKYLSQIISDVEKVANELLKRLNGLKVKDGKHRKWESIRKAVESAWTKDEIAALTKRLATFKDAVEANLLFSIMQVIFLRPVGEQ